ncbi:MAG: glycosyltransferase [Gammaproteobacteria bacterium]
MMTILFLIDEWSSAAGGIQTVNRELCLALGRYKKGLPKASFDVVCIAQRCTPAERADAAESDVILLEAEVAEPVSASEARVLRRLFHSAFSAYASRVACVVGHSKFTGLAAHTVRAEHFPTAKLVTVYHMDVDETEGLKEKPDTDWEARFKLEVDVAKNADIVFAIGPRLERLIRNSMTAQSGGSTIVRELLCGIRELEELRNEPPLIPMFLFVGRTDHSAVKGLDLFVQAAGRLVNWWDREWRQMPDAHEPQFIIRGLPADKANRLRLMATLQDQDNRAAGGRDVTLIPRPFTTDQRELEFDLRRASAVVMLSRAEGFGLVPLEAISLGIPAVVAREGGLAEVLEKYCVSPFSTADYIVDTRAADNDAIELLVRALARFVKTPVHGNLLGQYLREALVGYCSWEAAARTFIEAVFGRQPSALSAGAPDPRDEVTGLLRKEKQYVDNECRRVCGKSIKDVFVDRSFERWQSLEAYDTPLQAGAASRGVGEARKGYSWEDVVQSGPAIVLIADPGMGKTLCLLREVERRCESALSSLEDPSVPLDMVQPALYFHASEVAVRVVSTGEPTLEAVLDLVLIRHGQVSDCAREWMRHALHTGRVLIVVDALDEVGMPPDEDHLRDPRALLLERLLGLTQGATPSSVILSSRAVWYPTSVLSLAEEWRLLPLKRPQVLSAARKWMSGHSEVAVPFIRAVTLSLPLGDLLTNPMVLMLACRICEAAIKRGEEPPRIRNRTDLYTHCTDYLKARWIVRTTPKGSTAHAFPTGNISAAGRKRRVGALPAGHGPLKLPRK